MITRFKAAILIIYFLSLTAAIIAIPTEYYLKTGFNLAQHYGPKVDDGEYEVKSSLRPGLIAGVGMEYVVLPHFSLAYELLYSMKGSRQHVEILKMDGETLEKPAVMDVAYDLDYFEMPIMLKVKTLQTGKLTVRAITGTALSLKLKGNHELTGTVYFPENGEFTEFPIEAQSDLSTANMFDYSFVYGTELLYRGKFDASLELRFTLGWDYLQLPTYDLAEPAELRNQTYSAILGITF